MSDLLVGTFFNAEWNERNAKDIQRARELTAKARAELAAMSNEQLSREFNWLLAEADDILTREN